MAIYGVLGDIHGNREALDAVLTELEARGIRQFLCVGDVIGYNADPDECASMLRARRCVTIAGNHDLIGTGRLDFRRCSNNAAYALKRTRRALGRNTAAWLHTLPPHAVIDEDIVLIHGGVRDVQLYMNTPVLIGENAIFLREKFPEARVCFFGHSHQQKVYQVGETVDELPPAAGEIPLVRNYLHFINPGSVDASRKSSQRLAECAIFDTSSWSIEFLRLPYDAASTEIKAGMGGYRIPHYVDRLYTLRRRLGKLTRRLGLGRASAP